MELSAKETRVDGKRDCLRVARTLQDKLDGLTTSGDTDLRTLRKILFDASQELDLVLANNKATPQDDEISTCTHSCCEHEQVLNPTLWSTLPMELLQRVFAKLPVPNICRLKSLSKEWELSLESSSSEFTLALKESSPRMWAGVTSGGYASCWLHILDGEKKRWHALHVYVAEDRSNPSLISRWVHMRGAADAGLVCYVDKNETGLNCIFVINPMTGVVNQLPVGNLLPFSKLTMMRIVVDRDTYQYKVIVVSHGPPVEAEVYDSEVQKWTKPKPSLGRILGIAYAWRGPYHQSIWSAHESGHCAYDCRDGKYYDFCQDREKWLGKEVISYVLMEDRLFVLYWDQIEDAAFISEYIIPEDSTSWVKEERHTCFPEFYWQPGVPDLACRIHACNGFLFVFQKDAWLFEAISDKKHEFGWVYDLATRKWRALPRVPWWSTVHLESFRMANLMSEFQWNFEPYICELHWSIQP